LIIHVEKVKAKGENVGEGEACAPWIPVII